MKTIIKHLGLILVAVNLTACATPYAKNGFTGGYTDKKIDDTHYVVSFQGNGYASEQRVVNFWLYRCAELTKEKGFSYFAAEPNRYNKRTGYMQEPVGLMRPAVFYPTDQGKYERTAGYRAPVFIYVPGGTVTRWSKKNTITLYNDDTLPIGRPALKADVIMEFIGPYIKSDGKLLPPSKSYVFKRAAFMLESDGKLHNLYEDTSQSSSVDSEQN